MMLRPDPDTAPVTVGLPTYNRRDGLVRAADSVLAQGAGVHLVVSDNASTDGTAEVLAGLVGRDEVTVVRQRTNVGPTRNFRAVATERPPGPFMWLGDDDWIDEGYLAACRSVLESDRSLAVVAGRARYHDVDSSWLDPDDIQVLDDDPRRRVLAYYRQVGTNGAFYGVTRGTAFDRLPPLPDRMGGDWLHMAALAYLGRIRTLDTPQVHRTVGGATRSLADVARHAGLGWFSRTAPQLAIAGHVFVDIGWRSPVYGDLTRLGRLDLAARAAAIVVRRFVPRAVVKFVGLRITALVDRVRRPSSAELGTAG